MLAIRLARIGKKKQPFYRIVVLDKRKPRNGRTVEIVGTYDPLKNPAEIKLDAERDQILARMRRAAQRHRPQLPDRAKDRLSCRALESRQLGEVPAGPRERTSESSSSSRECRIVEGPMKELVEAIAKALVDHPDKCK